MFFNGPWLVVLGPIRVSSFTSSVAVIASGINADTFFCDRRERFFRGKMLISRKMAEV